jgi:hypothetical protein
MVRPRGAAVNVRRRQIAYWEERGWVRKGQIYTGAYRTRYGSFFGEIQQHSANDFEFFLYQPSNEIRSCGHWACFQECGEGWYLVHMGQRPRDISSGILTIERLITEAYEG